MSDPSSNPHITTDAQGHLYSHELYRVGFPSQLWETMRTVGYTVPPQYVGTNQNDAGINLYEVSLFIPSLTTDVRKDIRVTVTGINFSDACDTAAWRALHQFCIMHGLNTFGAPAGGILPSNWEVGESSSSQAQNAPPDWGAVTRYMDNINRMVENLAFSYGTMVNVTRERGHQIEDLQEQVADQVVVIDNIEWDMQELQMENAELQLDQGPVNPEPPAELPEQGDSGINEEQDGPVNPHLSDTESSVNQIPRARPPCHGWISEASSSEEEEDPEERIFFSDHENSE